MLPHGGKAWVSGSLFDKSRFVGGDATDMIRKATKEDISRIAEILVFVKRMKFRPIFQDDYYSFGELQVFPVAKKYANADILDNI